MTGILLALAPGLLALVPPTTADALPLRDGDRVVWLGNTLIERAQGYGYWETVLTARYPEKHITFRNLGWSGDTVFGEARAGFGSAADGFRHLKEHVLALKPTVIVVGYGANEAFQGEAGVPRFTQGLNVLLDTLAQTRARIILLSPLRQENLGRPLPNPARHNQDLRRYTEVLRQAAAQRSYPFVDLFDLLGDGTQATPPAPLTDNGIHLTAYGYWRSAAALESGLGLTPPRWRAVIDAQGGTATQGVQLTHLQSAPLAFQATDATLPAPPAPTGAPRGASYAGAERVLLMRGLAPGKYVLTVDGKAVATATAAEWAAGVRLDRGPEFDQVKRLRAAIIEKNRLYFYRWRPQNETYLFGFRKHEQGQNAREIPLFDPLVARREADIARLRVPAPHQYQLTRQPEGKK